MLHPSFSTSPHAKAADDQVSDSTLPRDLTVGQAISGQPAPLQFWDTPQVSRPKPLSVSEAGTVPESEWGLRQALLDLVGQPLAAVEKQVQTATSSRYAEVRQWTNQSLGMGGKRLRPALALLSAGTVGGEMTSRQQHDLVLIAASVEMIHVASLMHDDVLDGADQRRHQPTLACTAGSKAAVLAGDFLFTRAYALAAACHARFPARSIAQAATHLCEGEIRQQASVSHWDMSLRDYLSLLNQKTGALCAVSCHLGARLAKANSNHLRQINRFGRLLGVAFQIHDDWLDYWGTAEVGKTLGTDLSQMKPTYPLLWTLRVSGRHRAELIRRLERGRDEDLEAIRATMSRCGAGERTQRLAKRIIDQAVRLLTDLPVSPHRQMLCRIAHYAVNRER